MKYLDESATLTKKGHEFVAQLVDEELFKASLEDMEPAEALGVITSMFGILHMDIMVFYAGRIIESLGRK